MPKWRLENTGAYLFDFAEERIKTSVRSVCALFNALTGGP